MGTVEWLISCGATWTYFSERTAKFGLFRARFSVRLTRKLDSCTLHQPHYTNTLGAMRGTHQKSSHTFGIFKWWYLCRIIIILSIIIAHDYKRSWGVGASNATTRWYVPPWDCQKRTIGSRFRITRILNGTFLCESSNFSELWPPHAFLNTQTHTNILDHGWWYTIFVWP